MEPRPGFTDLERTYWSERQGRRPGGAIGQAAVRRLFVVLVQDFDRRNLLQEHFGYECVDAGYVPGLMGEEIGDRILLDLGREISWPLSSAEVQAWDEDTLFDMVEYLYDRVSQGDETAGGFHSYSGCGWHYSRFHAKSAQDEYRGRINTIFRRCEIGFQLGQDGVIERTLVPGTEALMKSAPKGIDPHNRTLVEAAISKFRRRGATPTDRRDAIRDLADVLEHYRPSVKAHLLPKDEGAFFEIANKFWIRHNKPDQYKDYDRELWWAWLFYVYLASIALVIRLVERQKALEDPQ